MKKSVVFFCVLLFLFCFASCEKKDVGEEVDSLSDIVETAETTTDEMELFSVDQTAAGEISRAFFPLDNAKIRLEDQACYFPLVTYVLYENDWTSDTEDGYIMQALVEMDGNEVILTSPSGLSLTVKDVCKDADTAGYETEILITDIVLPGAGVAPEADWVLPGGITPRSTAADVLSVYGMPRENRLFGKKSHNTENELYYTEHEKTGLSYVFRFQPDGTLVSAELYVPNTLPEEPCVYENDYFSLSLPGLWRGRYKVEQSDNRHYYEFRFIEGGQFFSITLSDDENEVNDNANSHYVFGTLEGHGKVFELSRGFATDDQAPDGFRAEFTEVAHSFDNIHFIDRLTPAEGYRFVPADYSDCEGTYWYRDISESGYDYSFELNVLETDGSMVKFTYGFYSQAHVFQLEDVQVIMSHGKGRFYFERDSWGYPCSGYIRFEKDSVFISVTAIEQSGGARSALQTEGEKRLPRDAGENNTQVNKNLSGLSKNRSIDENYKNYFRYTVSDLISLYGRGYKTAGIKLMYYNDEDLYFEAETKTADGLSGDIVGLVIRGDHYLGSGIYSDMTVSEIADVFGATDYPMRDEDGSYSLNVSKDGYDYLYHWDYDCEEESDYVYIEPHMRW